MHINFTSYLLKGPFLIVFYFFSAPLFSQNEKINHNKLQTAEIIIRKEFTLKKIKDDILKNNVIAAGDTSGFKEFVISEYKKDIRKFLSDYSAAILREKEIPSYFSFLRSKYISLYKVYLSQKDENDFSLFYREGITSGEVMKIKAGNQITGPNQPCDNSNFEQCNFNNWDLFTGDIPGNVQYSYSNVTSIAPGTQHIITTGGNDPIVPVNMVYQDGGSCSVRLGDANVGAKGASMKQTFLVDSANAVLTFSYAVVLEDGGHQPKEQPYFRVKVYDADSNSIPCGEYNVNAGPANSGGDPTFINQGGYSYKNWTSVFAPMNAYIGQNVTVEFIVGDCAQGGHAGWAYVEASCKPLEIITSSPVICGEQSVTLTAPPGAATYAWSGPNGAANTQSINTSIPGTYSVTVTPVSGSACSTILSTTLTTNPGLPIASFTVSSDSVCERDTISFFDQSTVSQGIITQYNWNFGTSGLFDTSHLQNPTYTYNWAGTYIAELSITTDAGCVKDTMITITVLDGFNATFAADTFCVDEPAAMLSAFSYGGTWSGTGITNSINGTFNPDSAGIGTFPITHIGVIGSCSDTFTANIIVDTVVTISTITVTEANCAGANDGAITITAFGATQFTINNGSGPIVQSNGNFSGLAPGTYSITVSSANNYCTADTTFFVINEPPAYAITFSTSNSNCGHPDGSAEVSSISGQFPPYSYSWSNGDSDSIASGIVNGNYSITITDSNGCDSVITLLVNVNLPPVAVATGTMTSCYGSCDGSANVLPSGGNPPGLYTFLWSDNQSTDTVAGLCAGTYTVTVYDSELCEGFASVVVQQPDQVIAVPFADTVICNSSSAIVGASAKGGNGAPYTYTWDNIIINPPDTAVQITPVTPVCFTVFASDVNGCSSGNQTQCISIFPPLTLFVSGTTTICEKNSTEISAFSSGGNPDSTIIYLWSNGSNDPFQTVTPGGNSSAPATYSVSVSDGCSPIATDSVIINFYPQVSINVSQTPDSTGQPSCNGTANVLVPGDPASYIYIWSNGQNTTTATGLCPGNYGVSVTDSFNCIHVDSVLVSSTAGVNYFDQGGKRPFSVYPNPSDGKFRINLKEGTGMSITIHNVLGEVIYRKEIQKPEAEVDLSTNPRGIYFLRANSEGTIHSIKLFLNQIQ